MKKAMLLSAVVLSAFGASAIWSRHEWAETKDKLDPGDGTRTWEQVRATIRTALLYDRRWPEDRGPLDVGGTLTAEEEQTQLLLWTALRSPVRTVPAKAAIRPETAALLSNARLKAIWADPNLAQSFVAAERNGWFVLLMDHGRIDSNVKIATFYNPNDRPEEMSLTFKAAQLAGAVSATDALTGESLQPTNGVLTLMVPAHGARMVRLEGERASMREVYGNDAAIYRESGEDVVFRQVYAPKTGRYRLTVEPAGEGTYRVEVNGLPTREGCRGVSQTEISLCSGHNFIRLAAQGSVMPAVNLIRIEAGDASIYKE